MLKINSIKLKFILFFIFSAFMSDFQAQNQLKYLSTDEVEQIMVHNEKNNQDRNNGLGLAYELNLSMIPEFIVDEFKAIPEVMDVFLESKTLKIYILKNDETFMDERLFQVLKSYKLENLKINRYIFIY